MLVSGGGGPRTEPRGEQLDDPERPEDPACFDPENPTTPNPLFFSYSEPRITQAKALCSGCIYREPCLEYALSLPGATNSGSGVWGGTDHRDRARILRARQPGAARGGA